MIVGKTEKDYSNYKYSMNHKQETTHKIYFQYTFFPGTENALPYLFKVFFCPIFFQHKNATNVSHIFTLLFCIKSSRSNPLEIKNILYF